MKKLVIYASQYGNTEKVAQEIAQSIGGETINVANATNSDLNDVELLIVGSPTQGGQATPALQQLITSIPNEKLQGVKVAAFDTRISEKDVNFWLRLLISTIGYAAPKINKSLISKGAKPVTSPKGFIVKGKEGPLADGELENARNWLSELMEK